MLFYCLKCTKNTKSKNPKVLRTKKGRIMLISECAVCDGEKQNLLKRKKLVDY